MPSSTHRVRRSSRPSYEAALSLGAAIALFVFYQFFGVSERDSFYVIKQAAVVFAGALSVWGAVRACKQPGKWNRRLALLTIAVLLTTIVITALLKSAAEPSKPQQIEYGGE